MLLAGLLLAYAACIGWFGDRLLLRVTPRIASPMAALWLWHGLALTVLTAIAMGIVITAHDVWEHSLAWLLRADKSLIHAAYAGPQEVPTVWNLALTVLLLLGAAGAGSAVTNVRRMGDARAAHRLLTAAAIEVTQDARVAPATVALVPEPTPMIYCLSGSRRVRRIVVTTGARDLLSSEQLEAALEHERAHLARGHHRMVLIAEVVAAALRLPRMLQRYPRAVRLLVELDADDRAVRRHDARTVASALLEISCAAPAGIRVGLAMAGTDAQFRIHRLLDQRRRAVRLAVTGLLLPTAIALSATPTIAAVMPAVSVIGSAHSPEDGSPTVQTGGDGFIHHP